MVVKRQFTELDEVGGGPLGNYYEYSLTDKPFMSGEREVGGHKYFVPVQRQAEKKILRGASQKELMDQYVTAYSEGWREYAMTRDEAANQKLLSEAPGGLTQLYIGGASYWEDHGVLYTPAPTAPNDGQIHQEGAGGALGDPQWLRDFKSWWASLWTWMK